MLLNLINNAFDIIENQEEKEISIRVEEHESTIAFKVIDNGPGAPNPEKLFLPFYTTKDVGLGTGLGLSLSRKIAESHKGNLTYSREENKTVFTLCLPKWRPSENEEDPEGSSSSQAA